MRPLFPLFLLLLAPFAEANQAIKFLGRGIYNKTSHEVLGLACGNDTCDRLQFALLSPLNDQTHRIEWLGAPIQVPKTPNDELQMKALQTSIELYLTQIQPAEEISRARHRSTFRRSTISWGTMGICGGAALALAPLTLPAVVALTVPVIVVGIAVYAYPSRNLEKFLSHSVNLDEVSEQSTDQSGWNWSVHPKKVKSKFFNQILKNLRNPSHTQSSEAMELQLKIQTLEKQGVEF